MIANIRKLDTIIEPILCLARVPGAAIAIVAGGETVFAEGFGYRDLHARLPMRPGTLYPIASTTKAINATLLGMLVDAGQLEWDVPVQGYLPSFRLSDPLASAHVTLRDLMTMRTGLPRHDWCWLGNSTGRAELVERMRYLELSCGFRERFQYNNLTVTAAGHIAEIVTGQSWELLVRERILEPLGMRSSRFGTQSVEDATRSYHETGDRELVLTEPMVTEVTAPSGGALHATVEDMAAWMAFNLTGGKVQGRQLVEPRTQAEIFSPQVAVGRDPSAPTPGAAYALGWFIDTYDGCRRISHGGYTRDVNSEVSLFPDHKIGIVSTTNFGCPRLARLINQQAFDVLLGRQPTQTLQEKLADYEKSIKETRRCRSTVQRVIGTSPSHPLDDHAGRYANPGYGTIEVQRHEGELVLHRAGFAFTLEHGHYDDWVAANDDMFAIYETHPLDATNRLVFKSDNDGDVAAVLIRFEPSVAAIAFKKVWDLPARSSD